MVMPVDMWNEHKWGWPEFSKFEKGGKFIVTDTLPISIGLVQCEDVE